MTFKVFLSETARNALNELSIEIKERIEEKLKVLKKNPWQRRANADITRVRKAPRYWRLRMGDYRAVYTIEKNSKDVKVEKITHSNKKKKIYEQVGKKS